MKRPRLVAASVKRCVLVIGRSKVCCRQQLRDSGRCFYEFQKEHRSVQELKKQVAGLTTDLQKVNAQLELSKSVSHVTENNRRRSIALRVKDWPIIADKLHNAGWSLGWISALDCEGRTI